MASGQVLDDELCYKYSEYHNIYEVYATRARMFRNVYLHRCVVLTMSLHLSESRVTDDSLRGPDPAQDSSLHRFQHRS